MASWCRQFFHCTPPNNDGPDLNIPALLMHFSHSCASDRSMCVVLNSHGNPCMSHLPPHGCVCMLFFQGWLPDFLAKYESALGLSRHCFKHLHLSPDAVYHSDYLAPRDGYFTGNPYAEFVRECTDDDVHVTLVWFAREFTHEFSDIGRAAAIDSDRIKPRVWRSSLQSSARRGLECDCSNISSFFDCRDACPFEESDCFARRGVAAYEQEISLYPRLQFFFGDVAWVIFLFGVYGGLCEYLRACFRALREETPSARVTRYGSFCEPLRFFEEFGFKFVGPSR